MKAPWLLIGLLSLPAQAQILAEDIDDLSGRKSFHVLCAATAAITEAQLAREPEVIRSIVNPALLEIVEHGDYLNTLEALTKVHADIARLYEASDVELNVAINIVRLLDNAGVFRLDARADFVVTYCTKSPEELDKL